MCIPRGRRPSPIGLTDSPVGMAAWMIDKIRDWCDCDGDLRTRFTDDELLTWLTLFRVTRTAESALDPYCDWALGGSGVLASSRRARHVPPGVSGTPLEPGQRIGVPTTVTMFTKSMDLPREWAERAYADLRQWTSLERGGHFAAWEAPEVLATQLRDFYRPLRTELT